jgi:hypothetical protein
MCTLEIVNRLKVGINILVHYYIIIISLGSTTVVEYSQLEGFYSVPLPAARQTPNLEDQ